MNSWDTASIYSFDSSDDVGVRVRRLERGRQTMKAGQLVTPSGQYSAVPSSVLISNQIDLASTGVTTNGSIPPTGFSGSFGFTATSSSITIYWDGTNGSKLFQRLGTDGSITQIAGSSMTISGLASVTTYGFLAFYSAYNNCGFGWVMGDSGTPKFAFTAAAQTATNSMQQALLGREPVTTGFITYSTTATGSSSGPGGGGNPCVMLGTEVVTLGAIDYAAVHYPCSEWVHIQADYPRSLTCTPDHPLYHASKGKIRAKDFEIGDFIITNVGEREVLDVHHLRRSCTKVQVQMDHGHLFWANGYLSHNLKKFP